MGGKGRRGFRNKHKGHMVKTKGGRWGWLEWGEWWVKNADNCT